MIKKALLLSVVAITICSLASCENNDENKKAKKKSSSELSSVVMDFSADSNDSSFDSPNMDYEIEYNERFDDEFSYKPEKDDLDKHIENAIAQLNALENNDKETCIKYVNVQLFKDCFGETKDTILNMITDDFAKYRKKNFDEIDDNYSHNVTKVHVSEAGQVDNKIGGYLIIFLEDIDNTDDSIIFYYYFYEDGNNIGGALFGGANYLKHIKDRQVDSANSYAKQVYTAAATYCTKKETAGESVKDGLYYSEDYDDFSYGVKDKLGFGEDLVWKVYIENGAPRIAIAAKSLDDMFIGSYPTEAYGKSNTTIENIYPTSINGHVNDDGDYVE